MNHSTIVHLKKLGKVPHELFDNNKVERLQNTRGPEEQELRNLGKHLSIPRMEVHSQQGYVNAPNVDAVNILLAQ